MQESLNTKECVAECGCKGIRTCLICEKSVINQLFPLDTENQAASRVFSYCSQCRAGRLDDGSDGSDTRHPHQNSDAETLPFPGVVIVEDFVTETEEQHLSDIIYTTPFMKSQSGRRKQDYGPKVNFKKQKVKSATFSGLPDFSEFLYDRMKTVPCLQDFIPVELCNLEYVPERGSSIDPHLDDTWLWGDRLVTVNLLSGTVLRFTKDDLPGVEVHVPLARRTLVVVFGAARCAWKHAIRREDIQGTRVAMTFRELSPEFQCNGKLESVGQELINVALTFAGSAVGCELGMGRTQKRVS